jgi:hypothetical protein
MAKKKTFSLFFFSWTFICQLKANVPWVHMAVSTFVWITQMGPIIVNALKVTLGMQIRKHVQVRSMQQILLLDSFYGSEMNLKFTRRGSLR